MARADVESRQTVTDGQSRAAAASPAISLTAAAAFVETTNGTAVRAFIERVTQVNGSLSPVDLVQTSINEKGRTLYRLSVAGLDNPEPGLTPQLRSSKSPFAFPFTWPNRHPPALSTEPPRSPGERKSLRATRSIPLLRVEAVGSEQPARGIGFPGSRTSGRRSLRRSGSSPLLTSTGFDETSGGTAFHGPTTDERAGNACGDGSGDVIGRLLGWREDARSDGGTSLPSDDRSRTSGRKATQPHQSRSGDVASGRSHPIEPTTDSAAASDRERDHRFAQPRNSARPPRARELFGPGLRLSRLLSTAAWQGSRAIKKEIAVEVPTPARMREVSSDDSMRTATANPQASTAATTGEQTYALPFGHHSRMDSSRSVATFRSDTTAASFRQITVVPTADDDPRFVVWGEKGAQSPAVVGDAAVSAHVRRRASPASSATNSPVSADRFPHSDSKSSPASSVRHSISSAVEEVRAPGQRILMAATVQRLVAELTSQIAPDLLADFFLTFRWYLAPLDLLHLLLARFDWAMTRTHEPRSPSAVATSSQSDCVDEDDEALRRIVRVRTFVVLRYWLLNHFMQDFYPSRDLRTTLTSWLNDSARDKRFRSNPKDLRLIKALKKTVRKCRDTFISRIAQRTGTSVDRTPVLDTAEDDADEEVNLDLAVSPDLLDQRSLLTSEQDVLPRPTDSLQATAVDGGLKPPGLIARRLSDAKGTIGRIKKKLGAVSTKDTRSSTYSTPPPQRSPRDRSGHSPTDLLRNEDRLKSYLLELGLEIEPSEAAHETIPALPPRSIVVQSSSTTMSEFATPPINSTSPDRIRHDVRRIHSGVSTPPGLDVAAGHEEVQPVDLGALDGRSRGAGPAFEKPMFSLTPGLFGPVIDFARPASIRVELDDLSDSSDDDDDVIEAKRVMKRLPPARTVGLGVGHDYRADKTRSCECDVGPLDDASRTYSALFVDDEEGYEDGELVTVIPNFTLDGLVDSDEEDGEGGVEAALRRLEGIVDDAKERRHAERVRQQMEKSSKLEEERRQREEGTAALPSEDSATALASLGASPAESVDLRLLPAMQGTAAPAAKETASPATTEQAGSPSIEDNRITAVGGQKPSSSRVNLTSRLFGHRGIPANPSPRTLGPSSRPSHRAYVMCYTTDVLVRHFMLIERDLLRRLSYQELADGTWRQRINEIDILDWETYVKERRNLALANAERGEKTNSAVRDLLARFNLTTNWVASEILLTASLDERVLVVSKFIRLAFKSYCLQNLQTMMQFVYGLLHPDVARLHQTWSRICAWELRKLDSMKTLCSTSGGFRLLRTYMRAAAAGRAGEHVHKASGAPSHNGGGQACLPFLGLLLQDLFLNAELPTLLDPTAPETAAFVDSNRHLLATARPDAFDGIPPLPSTTPLAPLVNVHKFRRLAETVRTVQTFQELSKQYLFEPVSAIYLRCLRLRALDARILHELSLGLEA